MGQTKKPRPRLSLFITQWKFCLCISSYKKIIQDFPLILWRITQRKRLLHKLLRACNIAWRNFRLHTTICIFTSRTVGALLRSMELTKTRFRFACLPPPFLPWELPHRPSNLLCNRWEVLYPLDWRTKAMKHNEGLYAMNGFLVTWLLC